MAAVESLVWHSFSVSHGHERGEFVKEWTVIELDDFGSVGLDLGTFIS